jgi:hypothetical protein
MGQAGGQGSHAKQQVRQRPAELEVVRAQMSGDRDDEIADQAARGRRADTWHREAGEQPGSGRGEERAERDHERGRNAQALRCLDHERGAGEVLVDRVAACECGQARAQDVGSEH